MVPHRQLWVNSVGYKTKLKKPSCEKGAWRAGRRKIDRVGGREKRRVEMSLIIITNIQNYQRINLRKEKIVIVLLTKTKLQKKIS